MKWPVDGRSFCAVGPGFGRLPGVLVCQKVTLPRGLSTGVQQRRYKVHDICGGAYPQRLTLLAWCPGRHPLQPNQVTCTLH